MSWSKRKNVKYVARVNSNSSNNKYRYFYSKEDYEAYLNGLSKQNPTDKNKNDKTKSIMSYFNNISKVKISNIIGGTILKGKNTVNKLLKSAGNSIEKNIEKTVEKTTNASIKTLNKTVDKTVKVATNLYDDKKNIYDVNTLNYDSKISKVASSKEWKDIVKRKDPEYVKKKSDGSTQYLIDDYLAKKKHPVLDIVDDISSGRQITVNKVEKDALVAGLKEHAFSTISVGVLAAKVATKVLIEKSKLRQGSYNDEVSSLYDTVEKGKKYSKEFISDTREIDESDVKQLAKAIETSNKAMSTVKEAKKNINEDDVITAARLIMNSEKIPTEIKDDERYNQALNTLNNLSEEEIALLNILLKNVRNGK